jgi:hypothetical protein
MYLERDSVNAFCMVLHCFWNALCFSFGYVSERYAGTSASNAWNHHVWSNSFRFYKKLGITLDAFIEILKQNGFDVVNRKKAVLGKNNNNILFSGYFYGRYDVINFDLFRGPASAENLNFYFPCKAKVEFNHYIIRSDNKVKIGRHIASVFLGSGTAERAHTDLSNILSAIVTDVDFLIINHLQAGPGFIRIATGPATLAYGEYLKKNTPAIIKFIQAFRTYYGCQDEKWDRQIDMNNLRENTNALFKEYLDSLRDKYKNK